MKLHLRYGRPAAFLVAALALLFSVVASASLAEAQIVHSSLPQSPVSALGRQIDWAHPLRVQQMPTRSGWVTSLPPNTVPLYVSPKAGLALRPAANFPGNCLNGVAYNVKVQGQTSWSNYNDGYTMTVYYEWCKRYSGDTVGQNWSYGTVGYQGCAHIAVGSGAGAEIYGSGQDAHDGESRVTYYVCSPHAVWDDSLTVPGNGTYAVVMGANLPDISSAWGVSSPCCY